MLPQLVDLLVLRRLPELHRLPLLLLEVLLSHFSPLKLDNPRPQRQVLFLVVLLHLLLGNQLPLLVRSRVRSWRLWRSAWESGLRVAQLLAVEGSSPSVLACPRRVHDPALQAIDVEDLSLEYSLLVLELGVGAVLLAAAELPLLLELREARVELLAALSMLLLGQFVLGDEPALLRKSALPIFPASVIKPATRRRRGLALATSL